MAAIRTTLFALSLGLAFLIWQLAKAPPPGRNAIDTEQKEETLGTHSLGPIQVDFLQGKDPLSQGLRPLILRSLFTQSSSRAPLIPDLAQEWSQKTTLRYFFDSPDLADRAHQALLQRRSTHWGGTSILLHSKNMILLFEICGLSSFWW